MSLSALFANGKLKSHTPSKKELDDIHQLVTQDLQDAAISALSADRRFATAYNAALQLARMVVACVGYRTTGLGHHQTTFEAAELALGPSSSKHIAYFDACRRKRNIVDYDAAFVASETEASQLLAEATKFKSEVEIWIRTNYPQLARS